MLKPGGRFAVSDIVYRGGMPEELRRNLEMWAGCLAGSLEEEEYVGKLEAAGFQDIGVEVTKVWKEEDLRGTQLEEAVDSLSPGTRKALPSFVSAFIRAQKPVPSTRGCCG